MVVFLQKKKKKPYIILSLSISVTEGGRKKDKELCRVVCPEVPNNWREGLSVRLCDVVGSVSW